MTADQVTLIEVELTETAFIALGPFVGTEKYKGTI